MNPNIAEAGKATRIQKGSHGLPGSGRKPSYLKKFIKEDGIGVDDIRRMLANLVKIKHLDEMKKLLTNEKTPMAIRSFSKSIISEFKQNKNETLRWLITYAYGMPKQTIEADIEVTAASINPAERESAFKQAMKEAIKKDPALLDEIKGE